MNPCSVSSNSDPASPRKALKMPCSTKLRNAASRCGFSSAVRRREICCTFPGSRRCPFPRLMVRQYSEMRFLVLSRGGVAALVICSSFSRRSDGKTKGRELVAPLGEAPRSAFNEEYAKPRRLARARAVLVSENSRFSPKTVAVLR